MDERKKHSREFKVEAVRLLNTSGKSGHEIESDLGIGGGSIYRWRKQLEAEGALGIRAFPGEGKPRDEELARLRKENAELREEREILRKAMAIFSRTKRRSVASSKNIERFTAWRRWPGSWESRAEDTMTGEQELAASDLSKTSS